MLSFFLAHGNKHIFDSTGACIIHFLLGEIMSKRFVGCLFENVTAWWTGMRPLKGDELERTREAIKNAAETFREIGDSPFDPNSHHYASTGIEGAKYRWSRSLKKLASHQLFCAVVTVMLGALFISSSR